MERQVNRCVDKIGTVDNVQLVEVLSVRCFFHISKFEICHLQKESMKDEDGAEQLDKIVSSSLKDISIPYILIFCQCFAYYPSVQSMCTYYRTGR